MWDLTPFRLVVNSALEEYLFPSRPELRMKILDCAEPENTEGRFLRNVADY
jgi:hypothetical protein